MNAVIWLSVMWCGCGLASLIATMDLEGAEWWNKPLLFALGPFGLVCVMAAGNRR